MTYPKKKTCTDCGKMFETTIDGQTECNACLLKPRKEKQAGMDTAVTKPVEIPPMRKQKVFKKRICNICRKEYVPTGPAQAKCPDCNRGYKKDSSPIKNVTREKAPENNAPNIAAMARKLMELTGAASVSITFR